jgi:hypothetical protein
MKVLTPRNLQMWAHMRGHDVLRHDIKLRKAFFYTPVRLVQAFASSIERVPKLAIDIKFKHMQKIHEKRADAFVRGFLVQAPDDFVPASIRHSGRTTKVKLRLKGDLTDHLLGDKWSFRIQVKDKDHIFGLRRFSIQHPGTRAYQAQPLFFDMLRQYGVLAPRYLFVDVTVNGDRIGIMALEEHFSKELLEVQGRPESVIIKFDESLFWGEWMANGQKGIIFNSYKNAPIDAFRSASIARSDRLSRHRAVAIGLLRGFTDGNLSGSVVFDEVLIGRFLAIAELWGTDHALAWNNMRFCFNPITAKLEPIGFDSFRRKFPYNAGQLVSLKEPIVRALLADDEIFVVFLKTLRELVNGAQNGRLLNRLKALDQRYLACLTKEFFLLPEFPFQKLMDRANNLAKLLRDNPSSPDDLITLKTSINTPNKFPRILHAYMLQDSSGPYLEIANAIPRVVDIQSIKWVSRNNNAYVAFEPLSSIVFPLGLSPTLPGELPHPQRIYYQQPPEGTSNPLRVFAKIQGEMQLYEINALPYYTPLKRHPIPASSLEEQLSQHPFLSVDREKRSLYIKPGRWQVKGSLTLPPGFSLTIKGSTTLQFEAQEGLIARGPLYFQGKEKHLVVLEGVSSEDDGNTWQGLVVIDAGLLSQWSHVIIRNTTGVKRSSWQLTGGATFYKSDVDMDHCTFRNNRGEDTLNIIQSKFRLHEVNFITVASDALDSDFSEGAIKDGLFQDIGTAGGGDGVDVSGSNVTVTGAYFYNISDKALSVGERSTMIAKNINAEHVGTGAASKDGSQLDISDSAIKYAENAGLMVYIKKSEFGPASINGRNLTFVGTAIQARAQKGNFITIDGAPIETEDINVEELYRTIMKPGLRK